MSEKAEAEAAQWLARLDRPDASAELRAEFELWLAQDPKHLAAYTRVHSAWSRMDRIRALRPGRDLPVNPDLLKPRQPAAGGEIQYTSRRSKMFGYGLAAATVLAVIGAWMFLQPRATAVRYATEIGGFERVVLADGSILELNTDTEVRVKFSAHRRVIELMHGEANFSVAHDKQRPFIVTAGTAGARAVGTRFNVERLDDSIRVLVAEGKVAVGDPSVLAATPVDVVSSLPVVAAGQLAVMGTAGIEVRDVPSTLIDQELAWQSGMLAFDGKSLLEAVAQMNRYNRRKLVIVDADIGALRLGGYFKPTNLDAFVAVLESNFGVDAQRTAAGPIELRGATLGAGQPDGFR